MRLNGELAEVGGMSRDKVLTWAQARRKTRLPGELSLNSDFGIWDKLHVQGTKFLKRV